MTGSDQNRRNLRLVGSLAGIVVGMVGLAYASVPLYEVFCRVTGFGGTTQVADQASDTVYDRQIRVRFDANVNGDLSWDFAPAQTLMDVKVGDNRLAFYRATNTGDAPVVGTAMFNVAPEKAGLYFSKIDCFCFTEQVLKPGQTMDMPVSFFLDPELLQDDRMEGVTEITLSYTFFRSQDQSSADTVAAKTEEKGAADDQS